MKPRTRKPTTLVIEPLSPVAANIDPTVVADRGAHFDPEDNTPIAPPPWLIILVHAGAHVYQRLRPVLLVIGGLAIMVVAFYVGATISARTMPPELPVAEPVVVTTAAELERPLEQTTPVIESIAAAGTAPDGTGVADPGPVPTQVAAPDMILLSVTVSPEEAQVIIDQEVMPSNPYVGRFARSLDTHHIRIVAAGYQSKEKLVSFSDNVMLDVSLTPLLPEPLVVRERPPRRYQAPLRRPPSAASLAPPAGLSSRSPSLFDRPVDPAPRPGEADPPRRRRIESRDPYAED